MSSQDTIRVPSWFASIIVIGGVAWLSWMSLEIISLEKDMSAVKEHLQIKFAHDEMNSLAKQ